MPRAGKPLCRAQELRSVVVDVYQDVDIQNRIEHPRRGRRRDVADDRARPDRVAEPEVAEAVGKTGVRIEAHPGSDPGIAQDAGGFADAGANLEHPATHERLKEPREI